MLRTLDLRLAPPRARTGPDDQPMRSSHGGCSTRSDLAQTRRRPRRHLLLLQHGDPMAQIQDGTSNTYLCGEKYIDANHYLDGLDYGDRLVRLWRLRSGQFRFVCRPEGHLSLATGSSRLPAAAGHARLCYTNIFGSAHAGMCNMAFCDGSVHQISYGISPAIHCRAWQPRRRHRHRRQHVLMSAQRVLTYSPFDTLRFNSRSSLKQLLVRNAGVPAVGGEHGLVELLVGQVEPGRALVVEVRQRPLLRGSRRSRGPWAPARGQRTVPMPRRVRVRRRTAPTAHRPSRETPAPPSSSTPAGSANAMRRSSSSFAASGNRRLLVGRRLRETETSQNKCVGV